MRVKNLRTREGTMIVTAWVGGILRMATIVNEKRNNLIDMVLTVKTEG